MGPRVFRWLAVCTLERLDVLTIVSGGLFSLLGDEDEPDAQQRIAVGLASLRLTRLELVFTGCLPAFPAALRHLHIEEPIHNGFTFREDVMTRIGELTRLTHLELSMCGVIDGLDPVSSLCNLESFAFTDNPRQSLAPLVGLTRLASLDLAGMYVDDEDSDVLVPDGLRGLDTLRVLNLSGVQNLKGWRGPNGIEHTMPAHTVCYTQDTTFV